MSQLNAHLARENAGLLRQVAKLQQLAPAADTPQQGRGAEQTGTESEPAGAAGGRQPAAGQVETSASMLRGRAEAAQAELQVAQLQAELRGAEARAAQANAQVSARLTLDCSTGQAARRELWPHRYSAPAVLTTTISSSMSKQAVESMDGVQPSSKHLAPQIMSPPCAGCCRRAGVHPPAAGGDCCPAGGRRPARGAQAGHQQASVLGPRSWGARSHPQPPGAGGPPADQPPG